jgi:hypothetical protein
VTLGQKPLRGGSSDRPLVCASAEVVVEHRTAECPLPKEMTLLSRLRLPAVYQDRPNTDVLSGLRRIPSAEPERLRGTQSSGFLNRVRWFDSCRGH